MKSDQKINALATQAFTQAVQAKSSNIELHNLLTPAERLLVGRRILIAQAILAGKTRYEINNHMSVSPNTFTQIRKWLESEFAEYTSAYKAESKSLPNTKSKERARAFSYQDLKQKYPTHFLLFSLVEELFTVKK